MIPVSENDKKRMMARECLLRLRVYRFFAIIFFVVGVFVFLTLYYKHIDGNFFDSLRKPKTVVIILVPFVPAVVFSWLSGRAEKGLLGLIDRDE